MIENLDIYYIRDVVQLFGWLIGCNAGDSSDVTLAFKDAQVIPPGWDDG